MSDIDRALAEPVIRDLRASLEECRLLLENLALRDPWSDTKHSATERELWVRIDERAKMALQRASEAFDGSGELSVRVGS